VPRPDRIDGLLIRAGIIVGTGLVALIVGTANLRRYRKMRTMRPAPAGEERAMHEDGRVDVTASAAG